METPKLGHEALSAWRAKKGLSQTEAAKLIGVTQAAWADWEGGKKRPRIHNAIALAKLTRGAVPVPCWLTAAVDAA